MIDFFTNIWNDPVWSVVIATGIITCVTTIAIPRLKKRYRKYVSYKEYTKDKIGCYSVSWEYDNQGYIVKIYIQCDNTKTSFEILPNQDSYKCPMCSLSIDKYIPFDGGGFGGVRENPNWISYSEIKDTIEKNIVSKYGKTFLFTRKVKKLVQLFLPFLR